jgi:hypothetical protein
LGAVLRQSIGEFDSTYRNKTAGQAPALDDIFILKLSGHGPVNGWLAQVAFFGEFRWLNS